MAGERDDEVSLAEEGVRVAEETGNINLQPLVLCALGIAHINVERWPDAVRACELAVRVATERNVWQFDEGSLFTFLALAHLGAGDRAAAARAAEDAVSASVAHKTPVLECGALGDAEPASKAHRIRSRGAGRTPRPRTALPSSSIGRGPRCGVPSCTASTRSWLVSQETKIASKQSYVSRFACSTRSQRRDTPRKLDKRCNDDPSTLGSGRGLPDPEGAVASTVALAEGRVRR